MRKGSRPRNKVTEDIESIHVGNVVYKARPSGVGKPASPLAGQLAEAQPGAEASEFLLAGQGQPVGEGRRAGPQPADEEIAEEGRHVGPEAEVTEGGGDVAECVVPQVELGRRDSLRCLKRDG